VPDGYDTAGGPVVVVGGTVVLVMLGLVVLVVVVTTVVGLCGAYVRTYEFECTVVVGAEDRTDVPGAEVDGDVHVNVATMSAVNRTTNAMRDRIAHFLSMEATGGPLFIGCDWTPLEHSGRQTAGGKARPSSLPHPVCGGLAVSWVSALFRGAVLLS
jgi:hypothetical protein